MSIKKLYVGSLSYSVTDETLKGMFTEFGTVESAKVITDYHTGRSKGFGFVEMSTESEADAAISKLHGSTHDGRTIVVSKAKPMEEGGRRGGGGRGGRGGGGGGRDGGRGGFNKRGSYA